MPYAGLVLANDGNFYGTTFTGGPYANNGTIFKMTPDGTLTSLYDFCAQLYCHDGALPIAGLVQGTDGNFYGTTVAGGPNGQFGTVFKITPAGVLTRLYGFCSQANCADGFSPFAGLVQAADGNFYGTTPLGGTCFDDCGTVFKITPSGTLTTLYDFCSQPNCADGDSPSGGLMQATDGNLYGTTFYGGANGQGTIFKITPAGALTTLYSFCAQSGCSDGFNPEATLVEGTDGDFYGTTSSGGSRAAGTVFKITPSGHLTTLHTFCSQPNCTDGSSPNYNGLVQATDGNFYGTAPSGGNNAGGTVYEITADGTFSVVYNFCSLPNCADGNEPESGVLQANDGSFYGTTIRGGANYVGTIFKLSGPSRNPVQFVPITPCRIVDTRNADGEFGGPSIQAGTFRSFPIPQGPCNNIPTTAAAYSLNVTVVPSGRLGYLTIWSSGRPQPAVSLMNSLDGRIKANAAIVPAGADAAVNVYASSTTNVLLDIDGYFTTAGDSTLQFYPLTPCRVVDTRNANGHLGGPFLTQNQERDFPILESTCIPSGISPAAYSLNVTAVPHPAGQRLGYLSVWPAGQDQPVVSTLNNPTGTIVANAAIVPAGTDGAVAVYPNNDTDLLIDINGYFAAPGTGGLSLYPAAPCRALDTRDNNGQPFQGERAVNVIGSTCAPPEQRPGLRLQRDCRTARRAWLPDVMARWRESAAGLDTERHRRRDHLEHGDRADEQRFRRCLRFGAHAADPRHLQLLCAVGICNTNRSQNPHSRPNPGIE